MQLKQKGELIREAPGMSWSARMGLEVRVHENLESGREEVGPSLTASPAAGPCGGVLGRPQATGTSSWLDLKKSMVTPQGESVVEPAQVRHPPLDQSAVCDCGDHSRG